MISSRRTFQAHFDDAMLSTMGDKSSCREGVVLLHQAKGLKVTAYTVREAAA